ncbi:MAG: hypothetical protein DRO00_06235 [Thermoproteota archaeon]|nr:MAG: hypothetical protein DRO00_06235 [Candidatus Korarchaeota archaeon]
MLKIILGTTGDKSRRKILKTLKTKGPLNRNQISHETGLTWTTKDRQLKWLLQYGFIEDFTVGKRKYFKIKEKFRDFF